jgi:hypothetical protein
VSGKGEVMIKLVPLEEPKKKVEIMIPESILANIDDRKKLSLSGTGPLS